jgi:hypothetical protein
VLSDASSKPTWEHPADQQVSKEVAHGIPIATAGINQNSPLDRLAPTLQKNLNNKQGTEKEHAAEG